MSGRNEGVQISGGQIHAAAMAVGRGASASNATADATETLRARDQDKIADRLAELVEALKADGAGLANPAEVEESAALVASELTRETPNKTTLLGLLSGITGAVGSVTSLTTAAHALTRAVQQFL